MFDFSIVTTFIDNLLRQTLGLGDFLSILIECVLVGICILTAYALIAIVLIFMERKVCAYFQCRLGPMRVGPWGIFQVFADVLKMLIKEIFAVDRADKLLYYMAPFLVIASGRIELRTTPTKMIVTDRARCSGCQRCEMMCTLKNDGATQQSIARVRVWDNYNFGSGVDTNDGIFGNCQFTVASCKQCADPQCAKYCPVHAIHSDEETGARVVDEDVCIGCGMCSAACPWNMPHINAQTGTSTKCISCGRCAEQCPNGAIKFIDWEDIAQKAIDEGVVSTATIVEA